jgi:hypothetical protein
MVKRQVYYAFLQKKTFIHPSKGKLPLKMVESGVFG